LKGIAIHYRLKKRQYKKKREKQTHTIPLKKKYSHAKNAAYYSNWQSSKVNLLGTNIQITPLRIRVKKKVEIILTTAAVTTAAVKNICSFQCILVKRQILKTYIFNAGNYFLHPFISRFSYFVIV
jgi:hypothetical protein